MVERQTENLCVVGSIPTLATEGTPLIVSKQALWVRFPIPPLGLRSDHGGKPSGGQQSHSLSNSGVLLCELSHNGVAPAFQAGPDGFDSRSSLNCRRSGLVNSLFLNNDSRSEETSM